MSVVAGQDAKARAQRLRYEARIQALRDKPASERTPLERLILSSADKTPNGAEGVKPKES